MNKTATDTMVSSLFSEEAERVKKKSWTSLWIALAIAVPCLLGTIAGFFALLIDAGIGAVIMFVSIVGFFIGVAFMARFAILRMKIGSYVGSQVRESQNDS